MNLSVLTARPLAEARESRCSAGSVSTLWAALPLISRRLQPGPGTFAHKATGASAWFPVSHALISAFCLCSCCMSGLNRLFQDCL